MDDYLLRAFISHLDRDQALAIGDAPASIQKWLEEIGLPLVLLRFMRWGWPQKDCDIALCSILSSESIYAHDATLIFLKFRFLNIGNAINGDWLVIDFSTDACAPGFIPFALWNPYTPEPKDPRELFQTITRSLDSFLYRAMEGRYIPLDSYAAQDFNEFLAEEKASGQFGPYDGDKPPN